MAPDRSSLLDLHALAAPTLRHPCVRWPRLFLAVGLALFSSVPALATHDSITPESLATLTSLLQRAENPGSAAGCREAGEPPAQDQCGFLAQCFSLSGNRDLPYIYTNSKGERAPNYKLRALKNEIGACVNKVDEKLRDRERTARQAREARDRKRAELELYRSVAANQEQEKLTRIQETATELALEGDADALDQDVSRSLLEIERRAGVSLSAPSRVLYLRYLGLVSPAPEVSTRAGRAEDEARARRDADRLAAKGTAVFEKAKTQVRRILERRRKKSNSAEIDNMIERVAAVWPEIGKTIEQGGECSGPDAYYSGDSGHKVVICPEFIELPEASLLEVLSHEIAHAIDPCRSSGPFYRTRGKSSGYESLLPLRSLMGDRRDGERELVREGIPLKKNPFSSVISCLASPTSVQARTTSQQDLRAIRDEISAYRERLLHLGKPSDDGNIRDADRALNEIQRGDWNESASCSALPVAAKTQIQESFSDWIASEVLEAEVASAPPELRRQTAFEATLSFTSMSCESFQPSLADDFGPFKESPSTCASGPKPASRMRALADEARRALTGSHPSANLRVDRIFLAQPQIRRALGCPLRVREVRKCE